MVVTTMFGFKALGRLSNLAVPLMLGVLFVMAIYTARSAGLVNLNADLNAGLTMGLAISAVVGGPAAGVVIFPDFARFAQSTKDGCLAAVVTYAIGLPLVLLLVGLTAIASGEKDLVLIMSGLGLGLFAFIFLVLVAWTTNAGNLYSSSLYLSNILSTLKHRLIVLSAGGVGVGTALLGITDHFIPFLVTLGISVPPIAGIYVTDYVLRGQHYELSQLEGNMSIGVPAIISWLSGMAIALMSAKEVILLTSIPAMDSILVSALMFALFQRPPNWLSKAVARTKGS